MPLNEVEIQVRPRPLPADVERLLAEAERRMDAFTERRLDDPIPGFVPSDFQVVYPVLETVVERHLAPGLSFCEWGSGFGVVALLASMVGFQACGIEIEGALVEEAVLLAEEFERPVEFVHGSFVPEGGEDLVVTGEEFAWLDAHGPSAYDDLGLDPEDFDVIFAYPWPGEEHVVMDLFERYASTGALLVTYQGVEDVRVRRKT